MDNVPSLKIIPRAVVFNATPVAATVGAAAKVEPSITTTVPIAALAKEADAPEIVAAVPVVGVSLY